MGVFELNVMVCVSKKKLLFFNKTKWIFTCFVFLFLVGPLTNSQIDGRLFWGYSEFGNVLPPLGLEVFVVLLFTFLLFLKL